MMKIQPGKILPSGDVSETDTEAQAGKPDAVPPHVWRTLQEAGDKAAQRLLDLLEAPTFARLKPGDQARLIQLALDRAYGPPIKREMTLSLAGNVSDAVAESLGRLAASDLPEFAPDRRKGGKMG